MAASNTAMTAKIIHEGFLKTIPNTRPSSIQSSSRQDDSQAHCCTASLLVVVCLGLSQLVVMVRELEVLPTRMDVHLGTEDGTGHCTALNVPAWAGMWPGFRENSPLVRALCSSCCALFLAYSDLKHSTKVPHLGGRGPRATPKSALQASTPSTTQSLLGFASRSSQSWTRPQLPEVLTRLPKA